MTSTSARLVLLVGAALVALMAACSDTEDYGNPYDALNPLTGGSPPNVKVLPGDQEATVTWFSMGLTGIDSYRVYRRFEGDSGSEFTLAGEEPAVVDDASGREARGHRYVFVDNNDGAGLMNDQVDPFTNQPIPYRYRLTVVDAQGVETPNPNEPPVLTENSTVYWPFERVTPSEAPEPPHPDVFVDDLWVLLAGPDYEPPGDAALYRVYGSPVVPGKRPELGLLAEITIQGVVATDIGGGEIASEAAQQYADTAFMRDETTKEYLVTTVDRFGVESDQGLDRRFQATVPNLPPKPLDWRSDNVTGVIGNFQVDFA